MQLRLTELVIVWRGFSENSVVVAEGQLQHNGSFKVNALGLPPVESRGDSLLAAKVRRRESVRVPEHHGTRQPGSVGKLREGGALPVVGCTPLGVHHPPPPPQRQHL